ncbi:MAG: restriction endonuclease subunit S [Bacteroidales bacterium]|nr:restriction endonuclease subunit S [Bacteroidales bacterium]
MKKWNSMRFERLGNICTVRNGFAFKSENFVEEGVPIIRISNINDNIVSSNKAVRIKYEPVFENFKIENGDILIAMSGATTGKYGQYYSDEIAYQNQRVGCFIVNDKTKLHKNYLLQALKILKPLIEKQAYGGGQPNISAKNIEELKIPLPSFTDQLHIANILSQAENLIAQRKESIRLLDEFMKSTFLEMFGDPVKNEKGFGIRKLSEFYINPKDGTKCGPFGSALKKEEYTESGIPVWTMYNILNDGHFVINGCLWISEKKHDELKNYNTINGDIIISRAGTVGKMCIINTNFTSSIISSNLIRLRLGNKLMPIYFLSLMKYFQSKIIKLKQGNEDAYSHMSTGILDKIKFPYPPIELQTQFAKIVEKTEALKTQYQQSLHELESLYGSLSQRAFKGELRAKDGEMMMAAEDSAGYRSENAN